MNKQEIILQNMKKLVGKPVLLRGGHPWEGHTGKTVDAIIPAGQSKAAMVVELDNGRRVNVFDNKHIMFITNSIKL